MPEVTNWQLFFSITYFMLFISINLVHLLLDS